MVFDCGDEAVIESLEPSCVKTAQNRPNQSALFCTFCFMHCKCCDVFFPLFCNWGLNTAQVQAPPLAGMKQNLKMSSVYFCSQTPQSITICPQITWFLFHNQHAVNSNSWHANLMQMRQVNRNSRKSLGLDRSIASYLLWGRETLRLSWKR